jgi:ribosomal protein S15P/S13E
MPEKTEEKKAEEGKKSRRLSQEAFEKKVIELSEKGLTSEKIGETLRKQGIHPKEFEKKISKVLGNRYINPDEKNIQEKFVKIEKHLEKNRKDKRAMRDKEKVSAKLRRLRKYLKKI